MVRFIAVCIAVTFVFVMSIPVIQISGFFDAGKGGSPVQAIQQAAIEQQHAEDDPFAAFAESEFSPENLNDIETAAGGDIVPDEQPAGFGDYFYSSQHPSFLDHDVREEAVPSELDL